MPLVSELDLPVASVVDPPLTTLVADGHELGAAAFELLAAVLDGRSPKRRRLPVQLVVRGSTGPAPAQRLFS